MSYHRGFGQVPAATAVTCVDGTIIGVPPGGDANALCLAQHLKPGTPTDVRTMPQPGPPTADEVAAAIVNAATAGASQAMAAQQTPTPAYYQGPTVAPACTAPASDPSSWVMPAAIGAGAVGLLWLAFSASK